MAFSHDGGRTFGPPGRVDDAVSAGLVGVELVDDKSAIVTWVESSPPRQSFNARRVDEHGTRGSAVAVGESSGTRYPRLARSGSEMLFAWTATEKGAPHVLTARARIR